MPAPVVSSPQYSHTPFMIGLVAIALSFTV